MAKAGPNGGAKKHRVPSWLRMDSVAKVVTAAVLGAVVITIGLTTPIYGKFHLRSVLIAVACSLPISYLTGRAGLRYKAIVESQKQKLEALNQDIAEANIMLKVRNTELDAFAHTVSHDLNNQLTGIINSGQLLMAYYKELEPEAIHEQLDVIVRNGFNSFEIIESMLLLTSAEDEPVEIKMGRLIECVC
jgi:signal transduction histidine kinase